MKKTTPFMTDDSNVINALEVNGKELAFGLTQMVKCVPPKPSLPILETVNIRSNENGRVVLVGTNLEHTVMFTPDSGYATPGFNACINARQLQAIAKRAGNGTVRITYTCDNGDFNMLVVEYGKKKLVQTGNQLQAESEFPYSQIMPPENFTTEIMTGRLNFILGLERTIPAAATDYDHPVLRGIMLTTQEHFGWLTMVATNGFILAEQHIDYGDSMNNAPLPPYVLGLDSAKTVFSILKAEKNANEVMLKYGGKKEKLTFFVVDCGRFSVITHCDDFYSFPNYKVIFDHEFDDISVSVPPVDDLIDAMVDAQKHTGNGGATLHVSGGGDPMVVSSDNVEKGIDITHLDHVYSGDNLSVSVNPGYMLDLIKPLKDERIEMIFNAISGNYNQAMFIETKKYRAAIMPMNLGR